MRPRRKPGVRPKGLSTHRSAVASLEFGLVAPVFAIFLLGLVDLADAIIAIRKLNLVAEQTGLIATQLSVQPNQTTTLTVAQLNEASSVIFAVWPKLASLSVYNAISEPVPAYAVVVSDVVFTPTNGTGCIAGLTCTFYTANLAWSVPLQYGQQIHRVCGTVSQTTPTAAPVIVNNLPSTVPTTYISSALTSTLVVDVVYQFTPIFAKFLGTFTMRQTAYFNQRSIVSPYITYNTTNAASGGVVCAGYS
jgi:Flp pilus assembly protein TadG